MAAANGMTAKDCAAQCGHSDLIELLEEIENQQIAADELAGSALALSHYQANTDADDVDIQLLNLYFSISVVRGNLEPQHQQWQLRLLGLAMAVAEEI